MIRAGLSHASAGDTVLVTPGVRHHGAQFYGTGETPEAVSRCVSRHY